MDVQDYQLFDAPHRNVTVSLKELKTNTNNHRKHDQSVDGSHLVVTLDFLCKNGNHWLFCRRRQTLTNHPGTNQKTKKHLLLLHFKLPQSFFCCFFAWSSVKSGAMSDWSPPLPLPQCDGGAISSDRRRLCAELLPSLWLQTQPSVKHKPDRKLNACRRLWQSSRREWKKLVRRFAVFMLIKNLRPLQLILVGFT